MKTSLLAAVAFIGLGLAPALAEGCCGGSMCGKGAPKTDMKAQAAPATPKESTAKAGGCGCCGKMAMGDKMAMGEKSGGDHDMSGHEAPDGQPTSPKP